MDRKTAILDHAERATRGKGYNGFSFEHIARAVGIQKASMYHHFASKPDLVREMFQRYSNGIKMALKAIDADDKPANCRILAYLSENRLLLEEGQSICLSIALGIENECLAVETLDELSAFHKMNVDWLESVFELAQSDGSIPNLVSSRSEAVTCLALVDGAQIMARSKRDVALFDEALMQFRSRLSAGTIT